MENNQNPVQTRFSTEIIYLILEQLNDSPEGLRTLLNFSQVSRQCNTISQSWKIWKQQSLARWPIATKSLKINNSHQDWKSWYKSKNAQDQCIINLIRVLSKTSRKNGLLLARQIANITERLNKNEDVLQRISAQIPPQIFPYLRHPSNIHKQYHYNDTPLPDNWISLHQWTRGFLEHSYRKKAVLIWKQIEHDPWSVSFEQALAALSVCCGNDPDQLEPALDDLASEFQEWYNPNNTHQLRPQNDVQSYHLPRYMQIPQESCSTKNSINGHTIDIIQAIITFMNTKNLVYHPVRNFTPWPSQHPSHSCSSSSSSSSSSPPPPPPPPPPPSYYSFDVARHCILNVLLQEHQHGSRMVIACIFVSLCRRLGLDACPINAIAQCPFVMILGKIISKNEILPFQKPIFVDPSEQEFNPKVICSSRYQSICIGIENLKYLPFDYRMRGLASVPSQRLVPANSKQLSLSIVQDILASTTHQHESIGQSPSSSRSSNPNNAGSATSILDSNQAQVHDQPQSQPQPQGSNSTKLFDHSTTSNTTSQNHNSSSNSINTNTNTNNNQHLSNVLARYCARMALHHLGEGFGRVLIISRRVYERSLVLLDAELMDDVTVELETSWSLERRKTDPGFDQDDFYNSNLVRKRHETKRPIKYYVGQVFRHSITGQQGIITGWEDGCEKSTEWCNDVGVDIGIGRNQVFYHAMIEDGSWQYIPENQVHINQSRNLSFKFIATMMNRHDVGKYFDRSESGNFVIGANLQMRYPQDL